MGQHLDADARDALRRLSDDLEHDVDVVDHEIEHHVDVERARLEHGQPVGLDELGRHDPIAHGDERGIEALDLPDLEHEPGPPRRGQQRVGLGGGDRERLLDEHVAAALERRLRGRTVLHGGHRDRERVHPPQHRLGAGKRLAIVLGGDLGGARGAPIEDSHQLDVPPRQGAPDAGVLLTPGAHAPDADAEHGGQRVRPRADVSAKRARISTSATPGSSSRMRATASVTVRRWRKRMR